MYIWYEMEVQKTWLLQQRINSSYNTATGQILDFQAIIEERSSAAHMVEDCSRDIWKENTGQLSVTTHKVKMQEQSSRIQRDQEVQLDI